MVEVQVGALELVEALMAPVAVPVLVPHRAPRLVTVAMGVTERVAVVRKVATTIARLQVDTDIQQATVHPVAVTVMTNMRTTRTVAPATTTMTTTTTTTTTTTAVQLLAMPVPITITAIIIKPAVASVITAVAIAGDNPTRCSPRRWNRTF